MDLRFEYYFAPLVLIFTLFNSHWAVPNAILFRTFGAIATAMLLTD